MSRPLPLRPVREQTRKALSLEELELRARWGGIGDLPPLTSEQAAEWDRIRRGRDTWYPQHALHYAWHYCDCTHGRPGWSLPHFFYALEDDQRDIQNTVAIYPAQGDRLNRWLGEMRVLGAQINATYRERLVGMYYTKLSELGYDGIERPMFEIYR